MITLFRFVRYALHYTPTLILLPFTVVLLTACQSAPAPTSVSQSQPIGPGVVIVTQPPANIAVRTATPRPLSTRRADDTVAVTATPTRNTKPNPNALKVADSFSNLRDGEVNFVAYVTPSDALISTAKVSWTFERSKKTGSKEAVLPAHEIGNPTKLVVFLPLTELPVTESTLSYEWTITDENSNTITTKAGRFKLTEATRAEQRNELPVVAAKQQFISRFPEAAVFKVTITPEYPILNSRIFITQNNGIIVKDYEVRTPTKNKGETLTLELIYGSAMGVQIPWQEFETWWVFIDESGRTFRTEHAFNDYADKKHAWKKTPTKHAILYTYSQTAANVNTLVTATDRSIEALEKEFGYKLLYKPHIVVYNTVRDFRDWSPPYIEDIGFIGMASGEWGGAVVAVYGSIRFTGYSIIKHEIAHLFQYQSVQQPVAQWFIEGSARYMEDFPEEDPLKATRAYTRRFGAPSLQLALPMVTSDGSITAWPYYAGSTFVTFLKETYGAGAFAQVHLGLARNLDLPAALEIATGKTFAQLDSEWGKWISK
jgi:hypothetical protein